MIHDINMNVADIVRSDYRTADVFKKYGINFCCSGQITLANACQIKQLDSDLIVRDIDLATRDILLPSGVRFDEWDISFLADYIVHVHHAFLSSILPPLEAQLASFAEGHKKKYPGFADIVHVFRQLSRTLDELMQKEEAIIFPYIKQIESTHRRKESYGQLFVRTLRKPLALVDGEHRIVGELLTSLQSLTNHYTFGSGSCTTYQVLFHKLRAFNDDLIQHAHLENNILFPTVVRLEQELLGS